MLKATDFEILRDVKANGRISVPLAREPKRVVTLIDEAAFNEEHLLVHHRTVFFEDRYHDWDWSDGKIRYYGRMAEKADVLIIYDCVEFTPAPKFDSMTGERLASPRS